MNHHSFLPICFLLASLSLTSCAGLGSPQTPTPRRGFVTATVIPASETAPPTFTAAPSATSTEQSEPDQPASGFPTQAPIVTSAPTETPTFTPTPRPPTPRPVVVRSPTPMVIDVDLSALLAQDASGAQKDPAAFALSFLPDQRILHAVAKFSNVPAGTKVKAVWTAVDLAGALPPNTKLGETEFVAGGMPNLDFGIPTSIGSFLPGKYRVEISLNGRLDTILNFSASAPPDVYVTALEVQPSSPKRGENLTFVTTFLNTTGGTRSYDWLVLIFRPGQTKSFGESGHQGFDVPPGRTQGTIANTYRVTGIMECESFTAQAYFRDEDKNRFPFKSLDGKVVSVGFSVCPP